MPLDFAEFAHHYEAYSLSENEKRDHFDAVANLLECVVRLFWQDGDGTNTLGITLVGDTLSADETLESRHTATIAFNTAASDVPGKKEP